MPDIVFPNSVESPNPDGLKNSPFILRHSATFRSQQTTPGKTYRWHRDEALLRSESDARAMRRDGWIRRLLRERAEPVCLAKWHLEAEDENDPLQTAAIDLTTKIVERIPRFSRMRMKLRECNWFGVYGTQVVIDKQVLHGRPVKAVTNWLPIHGDKIGRRYDGTWGVLIWANERDRLVREGATVLPTERGYMLMLDKANWRERFIFDTFDVDDADWQEPELAGKIIGVGLRDELEWLWWLRNEVLGQLMDFLSRIGAGGITVIRYEEGNNQSFLRAQQIAKELETNNTILAPEPRGTAKETNKVERIEPGTAGADIIIKMVTEWFDSKIERVIVGQAMSSGKDGADGLGGTGRANFATDTKYQILKSDAANLDETLTEDLIGPLVRWNYPGAAFRLKFVTDLSDPGDTDRLDAVKTFVEMGGEVIEDEVRQLVGLGKPGPGDKTLSQAQQMANGMGPDGMPMAGGPPGAEGDGAPPEGDGGGAPGDEQGGDVPDEPSSPEIQSYFADAVESGRLFTPDGLAQLQQELSSGSWKGPQQYAREKAQWSSYTNPETGKSGWRSARGRVVYEDPGSSPEEHPHGRKPREEAPQSAPAAPQGDKAPQADHPGEKVRRHVGVERGKAGDLPALQTQLGGMLNDPQQVTPGRMANLVSALMGLTVQELHQLRQQYGGKRGRKGEMVQGLTQRLQGEGLPAPGQRTPITIDATPEVEKALAAPAPQLPPASRLRPVDAAMRQMWEDQIVAAERANEPEAALVARLQAGINQDLAERRAGIGPDAARQAKTAAIIEKLKAMNPRPQLYTPAGEKPPTATPPKPSARPVAKPVASVLPFQPKPPAAPAATAAPQQPPTPSAAPAQPAGETPEQMLTRLFGANVRIRSGEEAAADAQRQLDRAKTAPKWAPAPTPVLAQPGEPGYVAGERRPIRTIGQQPQPPATQPKPATQPTAKSPSEMTDEEAWAHIEAERQKVLPIARRNVKAHLSGTPEPSPATTPPAAATPTPAPAPAVAPAKPAYTPGQPYAPRKNPYAVKTPPPKPGQYGNDQSGMAAEVAKRMAAGEDPAARLAELVRKAKGQAPAPAPAAQPPDLAGRLARMRRAMSRVVKPPEEPSQYAKDASGHEHKGKGAGGGQFTGGGDKGGHAVLADKLNARHRGTTNSEVNALIHHAAEMSDDDVRQVLKAIGFDPKIKNPREYLIREVIHQRQQTKLRSGSIHRPDHPLSQEIRAMADEPLADIEALLKQGK